MTSVEQQRTAHDRRARAWTFLVLGALVAWVSMTTFSADFAAAWRAVGGVAFLAGIAGVVYGIVLFQKRRP